MSKICICIINTAKQNEELLRMQISSISKYYDFTVFWDASYEEPFLERYCEENHIVFSLSDEEAYDNCEMLLLPDQNLFNGRTNPVSFSRRMEILADFLEQILVNHDVVDLFVGDSGTDYSEFEEKYIHVCEFSLAVDCLNTETPPDLHLSIIR